MQVFVKLGHHLFGLEALAISGQPVNPACHHSQQAQVFFHDGQHTRTQHLHRHLTRFTGAVLNDGKVHLCNGGAGNRDAVKRDEEVAQLLVESSLYAGNSHVAVKRWHLVLQAGELVCDVKRQQIAPSGEHLAKLDKNRTQAL